SCGAAQLPDGHQRPSGAVEPKRFGRSEFRCGQCPPIGVPRQIERQLQQVHEQAGAKRERPRGAEEEVSRGDREAEHKTGAIDAERSSHQKFPMTSSKTVSIDAGFEASYDAPRVASAIRCRIDRSASVPYAIVNARTRVSAVADRRSRKRAS